MTGIKGLPTREHWSESMWTSEIQIVSTCGLSLNWISICAACCVSAKLAQCNLNVQRLCIKLIRICALLQGAPLSHFCPKKTKRLQAYPLNDLIRFSCQCYIQYDKRTYQQVIWNSGGKMWKCLHQLNVYLHKYINYYTILRWWILFFLT